MYKRATPISINHVMLPVTKKYLPLLLCTLFSCTVQIWAQPVKPLYVKDTRAENRTRLYKSLVNHINKDLSLALADSTEEYWMDAFYSIELLRYRLPWVESRIHEAFNGIDNRSVYFRRSLLEMLYDSYPVAFEKEVKQLLDNSVDSKLFAMCAEYLLRLGDKYREYILVSTLQRQQLDTADVIFGYLFNRLTVFKEKKTLPPLKDLLQHRFFTNDKVVYSFQRKNRNYPGITIVRDSAGNFVTDADGHIFAVPQLARSISNLPGYLSNGNTPQGIFRMQGFAVSKSIFLGPTPNIQLTMPVETSIQHFLKDSSIADSIWSINCYNNLLPGTWKTYAPMDETYYAGKAGRTEIIAHGSTVDPSYYKGQPYYPLTPTLGCLSTKEWWSGEDGTRKESDQQKLVDALQQAGGADGYYIVIELNDEQRAVDINDVLSLLK